ncbi:glycoside hydrolase family 16 protein [Tsuneonella sp. YG55]|uniref:Glycoside hydrolase family 16 protein n=1 Tax=Tsuneonella litorea TaxID=2976475 RepID=A0A9X3AMI2_9SPHN|nr:glycoside hydrolase family 16 protein [Tsuneonella litorea]MCT2558467.1 glycoside hydrolase family 16 protein [Tsuneonella litorea]
MTLKTALPTLLALAAAVAGCAAAAPPASAPAAERTLLFSDEFDGTALDRSKWVTIGPDFWVNNEQQVYVDRPDVLEVRDGMLVLTPRYAPGVDTNARRNADFIAGRVETAGKFNMRYGRVEARIRMPDAEGVWPAFWMVGNGPWPTTGEIDVMEYVGEKDWTGSAIHGPGYSGDMGISNRFYFPEGEDVTGWHVYAAEWKPDTIEFFVDGRLANRVTRPMGERWGKWVFNNPERIVINFALGGAYPRKINNVTAPYEGLPKATVERIKRGEIAMQVDWVRVWK